MNNYAQKLMDPRWQKKRLEIFERDSWKCLCCGDSNNTLQVHHLIYTEKNPWDEPSENLETLCTECHESREDFNRFVGGRTKMPTKLIYALIKWTFISKATKPENRYGDLGYFLHFFAPEFLPKGMDKKFEDLENKHTKPACT